MTAKGDLGTARRDSGIRSHAARLPLVDLLARIDYRGLSMALEIELEPSAIDAIAGSERLRRRWAEVLRSDAGYPASIEHDGSALVRILLDGTKEEIDAFAHHVAAHLDRKRIIREITGAGAARLRERYGDPAYEAAFAWTGATPDIAAVHPDPWAVIDDWIAAQESPLRLYLKLRRPASMPRRATTLHAALLHHAAEAAAGAGRTP